MDNSDKSFSERIARLQQQERHAPRPTTVPTAKTPEQTDQTKKLVIFGSVGATLFLTLSFFAGSIADMASSEKLLAANVTNDQAMSISDDQRSNFSHGIEAIRNRNKQTEMMASFGKLHAEQVAKYGNAKDDPTEGLDRKTATSKDIAGRMEQYIVPSPFDE